MKKQNFPKKHTKDVPLPNDLIRKILKDNYYTKSMQQVEDIGVDINHLENIFTDQTYYQAMKIVPLLERKVLYLTYIENARLNDICRRLKLSKMEVISIRKKGITHFKNNWEILSKAQVFRGDSK